MKMFFLVLAYNEEEFLKSAIINLKKVIDDTSIENFQIIIIDDGSTDKTADIALTCKKEIDQNILEKNFAIIDARSKKRFNGEIPEPRKGLRSGSIKNSFCLPFSDLISSDGTFVKKAEIAKKFHSTCELNNNIVFSCGSGVTAAVLAFAYSIIKPKYAPIIYDGSWSEYGKYPE